MTYSLKKKKQLISVNLLRLYQKCAAICDLVVEELVGKSIYLTCVRDSSGKPTVRHERGLAANSPTPTDKGRGHAQKIIITIDME